MAKTMPSGKTLQICVGHKVSCWRVFIFIFNIHKCKILSSHGTNLKSARNYVRHSSEIILQMLHKEHQQVFSFAKNIRCAYYKNFALCICYFNFCSITFAKGVVWPHDNQARNIIIFLFLFALGLSQIFFTFNFQDLRHCTINAFIQYAVNLYDQLILILFKFQKLEVLKHLKWFLSAASI